MADEDNFDIDIYGDEAQDEKPTQPGQDGYENGGSMTTEQPGTSAHGMDHQFSEAQGGGNADGQAQPAVSGPADEPKSHPQLQNVPSESTATPTPSMAGTKRKTYDGRNVDPNATSSAVVSELHWWHTEDDVRGWCARAEVEDDIKDITFNEHKVNGKSKGYVAHRSARV